MTEKVSIQPKILELQSTNDVYMTMTMAILSTETNMNKAKFTDDFVDGVIENKEKFVGIPFLASKEKLENGDFDNLTHELNLDTGKLETDQIGSFVDFWKEEVDGADCLMGEVRIFKRFPEVCASIKELYADGLLETSCEVLVADYAEVSDDGVRSIHFNNGDNALIGSAAVTTGAERRAKPTMLVAEAYQKDISSIKEGDKKMVKSYENNNNDKLEMSNKGIKVKYHGKLETSSLSFDEIFQKVYGLINPVDVENGGRDYNYYILEIYNDKVIIGQWDDGQLLEAKYNVDGETLTMTPKEDWVSGQFEFVPDYINIDSVRSDLETQQKELSELEETINTIKGEKETMSKELEAKVEELNETIEKLQADLDKANEMVVSEQETKQDLDKQIEELNEKVKDLEVYKENYEKAEMEKQQKELSDKYIKLFDEETFQSEEVQNAIKEVDTVALNSKFVEVMAQKKEEEIETANQKKDIEISSSKNKDLVPKVKDASYWASSAK